MGSLLQWRSSRKTTWYTMCLPSWSSFSKLLRANKQTKLLAGWNQMGMVSWSRNRFYSVTRFCHCILSTATFLLSYVNSTCTTSESARERILMIKYSNTPFSREVKATYYKKLNAKATPAIQRRSSKRCRPSTAPQSSSKLTSTWDRT
jgi:hypothetical protein